MKIKNKKYYWKKPPGCWNEKLEKLLISMTCQKKNRNGKADLKR